MLTDTEKAILDLEARNYRWLAIKATIIRNDFGWSLTRYFAELDRVLRTPEALEYAPSTVRRLERLRERRVAARQTSRLQPVP